jgi:hypothetical protein
MVNARARLNRRLSVVVLIALAIRSAAVRAGTPQNGSAQDVGPSLPRWCLLPRTPFSPALWTDNTQTAPEQSWVCTSFSALHQNNQITLFESASVPQPGSAGILPATAQAVTLQSHLLAQRHDGPRTTDRGIALMFPPAEAWPRVSQAITILHVEPAFPSLLPASPLSPGLWTHDTQRLFQQAREGEKSKKERGESTASQRPPVLLATDMAAGDQVPAQGQNESLTKRNAGTAAASQKSPTLAPGEKGADALNQAGKSGPSEKPTTKISGQSTQGEKGKGAKGESPASQTVPVGPSSGASQEGRPTVPGYNGPGTRDHASGVALLTSAGELGRRALRDPFKLPPPPRPDPDEKDDPKVPGNRPPGSRGLLVEQLRLKGVVRDGATQKMIAVVTTNNNRAYFLREGEAVYDGVVSKITSDAVYFKGNIFDAKHEVRSHEVVKTLSPAPGEVR